ncbi:hypothetical protein Tco_0743512 [Tanacetum coccineum]
MLESNAYKTYYAFTFGEKTPKPKYIRKKADPDTSPKQKPVQATKGTKLKSKAKVAKTDKKKQPSKKTKAKGLAILSEVALTKAEQLKLVTKRSKTRFYNEGTGTIPGVPDVPIYESKSEKESWGDSEDEDEDEDDENNSDDLSDKGDDDNDGNDGNDNDDDANDDDKQEGDDTNDVDEETDSDRTESDRIKIPVLDQSTTEFYEEEEEYDDEFNIKEDEKMDEEEDNEVTKELFKDVNINLGNKDADMIDADQGGADQQNVSQQSGFEQEEEDAHVTLTHVLEHTKVGADNKIASLMDTTAQHAIAITEITLSFTTIVPPPPSFFNPLLQEATPTPTPTTSETTTPLPTLPDFASIFKFNERVFNLEKDVSEIKQVDQYAQALSSIPAIVDCYMDKKLGEVINNAIQTHNFDCREEAQAEKREYIELILPQAISDVATPIIKKNVTGSVEALVLTRSSSQLASTYEADASLSEFELTKILIDKMEKNKSYDKADYKKKLYDALVESYNL